MKYYTTVLSNNTDRPRAP